MKKINVLHLTTQDNGGAGMSATRLAIPMNKYNIDSNILCLIKTTDSKYIYKYIPSKIEYLLNFIIRIKNRFLRVLNSINLEGSFSFLRTGFNQTNNSLYKNADIIQLHSVSSFVDYKIFFKKNKKPIIWTLHDMAPFSNGYHYKMWDNGKAEIFSHKKVKYLKNLKNITIVSPSKWLLNESKNSLTFKNFEHVLIPYGLNNDIYKIHNREGVRKKIGIGQDKKVILFVADSLNNTRKGINFLMDILPDLLRIDKKIFIITVGETNRSFKKYDNFMKNMGYIKDELFMAEIYSCADLFVIPSIEDNLPNTMIESVMCGTPVAGFSIGGIPDVIINGKNGFLSTTISSKGLLDVVVKSLNFNFSHEEISKQAHDLYSEPVSIENYKKLYKEILLN
jgi:glycosyltransferase involved in cell wall biosynthesis